MKIAYHRSLMTLYSSETPKPLQPGYAREVVDEGSWSKLLGWALTLVLPLSILGLSLHYGMDTNKAIFLSVLAASLVMWVFVLVDEYIPGLFALLVLLSLGLVPSKILLSGFASDAFFMAMSFFALGAVISVSGLSYRLQLMLMHALPNTLFWQNMGLIISGSLYSAVIPTINARVDLMSPILLDMVQSLKLKSRGKAATCMSVAAFTGVTIMSATFLTSKSANFVIFGLLSLQIQEQFQWVQWMLAASVTAGVMLALYLVLSLVMFRNSEVAHISQSQVVAKLGLLGKVKPGEWAALISIVLFMVGVLSSSIHKISPSWLGVGVLCFLLIFGHIKRIEFRSLIDWPFLIYMATLIGIVSTFNYLGFDRIVATNLGVIGTYMRSNFGLFVAILAALIFVVRFIAPIAPTIVIMATIFMPLAELQGVNPWVVGFIILLFAEMWVLPSQFLFYRQFKELTYEKEIYNEKSFLTFNVLMNFVKIAGVYAAIPYWRSMGIL